MNSCTEILSTGTFAKSDFSIIYNALINRNLKGESYVWSWVALAVYYKKKSND